MQPVTRGRVYVAPSPEVRWLGGVSLVAIVALTAQILFAHRLGGRETSAWLAFSWAAATIGAWSLAAGISLVPARLMFDRISRRIPRSIGLLVVAIACVVLAAAVRTAIDPLLPSVVQQDVDAIGELFRRYVIRWSGPGMLVALAVVSLPWIVRLPHSKTGATSIAPLGDVPPTETPKRGNDDTPTRPAFLETLVVRIGERSTPVAMAEVHWIAASGNYAELHGVHGRQFARITMTELEQRLDPDRFVRVHRSAIVALAAICEVRRHGAAHEVVLVDGNVLSLSRVGRKALEARIGHRS